jgi:competence protein ComEC
MPWGVVAYGVGIVAFFAVPGPVPVAVVIVGAVAAGMAAAYLSERWIVSLLLWGFVYFAVGFTVAHVRTGMCATPAVSRIQTVTFSGTIANIDREGTYARVIVSRPVLEGFAADKTPENIRLRVKVRDDLRIGAVISGKARLYPPSGPAIPGGYDFARDAYFKRIGATGRVQGEYTVRPGSASFGWRTSLMLTIENARNVLTERIVSGIGGQAGAVSAALITGKRGLIDDATNASLRAAGIYHIVSISGLHMVLAAGIFFWLFRATLALSPYLALAWPIKKIAAVLAMAGATGYCLFAGSEVATERSLIMTLVMLGAVLADRPVLSVRNVSIAAFLVLLREPEALLGPSFQMSFSAVLSLIAMAELWQRHMPERWETIWILRQLDTAWRVVLLSLATTFVAGLATAPFAAYHFQMLQSYGLIGNALILPLVSLVVMPSALIGVLLYPFGLDGPVWMLMGMATDWVLLLSDRVAELPNAVITMPQFGQTALLLMVLAILWATLPSLSLRKYALLPALLGIFLAATPERFVVAVDRDGEGAAIRGRDGRLFLVGKASEFQIEQWLRADGDGRFLETDRKGRLTGLDDFKTVSTCDTLGCVGRSERFVVSVVKDPIAFDEDCRRADIIVSRHYAPGNCAARLVADRAFLRAHGSALVYLNDDKSAGYIVKGSR